MNRDVWALCKAALDVLDNVSEKAFERQQTAKAQIAYSDLHALAEALDAVLPGALERLWEIKRARSKKP